MEDFETSGIILNSSDLLDFPLQQETTELINAKNHIKLPVDIAESPDPEDQVIRELSASVNMLTDLLEKRSQTHVKAGIVSRKVQGLKVLGEHLAYRRERMSTSSLRMMATLLKSVHSVLTDSGMRPEQQQIFIQNLAMKIEEAQRQDTSLKLQE